MAGPSSQPQKLSLSPAPKRFKRNHPQKDLPYDVVEKIFSFLPIKKVVQLGTVSMRFRNSWFINRKLHFDEDFAKGRGREEIMWILNSVFRHHLGSKIDSFRLYFNHDAMESKAESWIRKSVKKGVEELDLDFRQGKEPFQIVSDLIDVESIRILKLSFCELHLPLKPKGLCSLNTLVLRKMPASEGLIQTVFANCLLLENLELLHCSKVFHLKISTGKLKRFRELKVVECTDLSSIHISAPTLRSFFYHGYFSKLSFNGSLPQLKDVILCCPPARSCLEMVRTRNLLLNLVHVACLTVSSTFLEGLSQKYEKGDLRAMQFSLGNMKELHLIMDATSFCNPHDISSFIRNCPCIEKVFIDLNNFSFGCGYYWELHAKKKFQEDSQPLKFEFLKYVKLKGFKFERPELELVRLFLEKAIILENLALITPKNRHMQFGHVDAQVYKHCFLKWRASPKAKIVLYEKDSSSIVPMHLKTWC
ncbi:putative FBD-associated F-box protein [Vitis vinifera]|uniref:Putative FBD-associated F-box protein n=1 Tax=Vitis vinifera TaxID=29760 RepID=A0A438JHU2_VITVI|nr:putative FBD-associated F-box protein [Vitis vinifera]|eukprot:XP_010646144.1 PREDICTED: putative FBD-associated F-box protein At1g61330 [Vitis vinifera]